MSYLGLTESQLKENGAYWTAKEISQQPESWMRTQEYLWDNAARINDFLQPLLARDDCRIILTGAGTSAFAGKCLAPSFSQALGRHVEAIPTTDLVSGPGQNLHSGTPTLLVSFARSGNSPESVAAADLADSFVDECYQLVLSCNADGGLYRRCEGRDNCLALLMPEETNDRAFAMTSSFTCMLLAAISVFTGIETWSKRVARLSSAAASLINTRNEEIRKIAELSYSSVVYLGSNGLTGLAQEASLKLLELTDGRVRTMHESSLGFRHGPKSAVDDDTLVVVFMSGDSYTRKYDADILNELIADKQAKKILALTQAVDLDQNQEHFFTIETAERLDDLELLFPYVVFAQIYGFHHSLRLGNRPDTPSASGTVNRVVKGVNIHACTA